MVYIDCDLETHTRRFVIRPHRSLSWRELGLVYAGFATVSLTLGFGFFLMGLTLILPFAGLEMLALGAALYHCQRKGERREVVSVGRETVTVEKGRRGPTETYQFPRSWVRVQLEAAPHAWYPRRLTLRSHGRAVELGRFLCEDERRAVAQQLQRALADNNEDWGIEEKAATLPTRGD